MDLLEINLFGPFRMSQNGQDLTEAATDKTLALLTFLALEGTQARTSLSALLWPYLSQAAAFNNLRKTLYRLRQRLDEGSPGASAIINASRQYVQLNLQHTSVDVLRFQTLLAETNHHTHKQLATCGLCLARLADAADLYQGELLTGFGLDDSPAFEEWLLLQRETLQQQALMALVSLAAAWGVRGDFARAHLYYRRALAIDPLYEEAQRQQMRLLVHIGQRNEAMQQYENFRRLLYHETGFEPDAETVALYQQIRRGNFRPSATTPLATPHQTPASEGVRAVQWREVPETGRVYGRTAEVSQLQAWLHTEPCQLVAILGIGGVGKTTLAATIAHAVADNFDIVIWRSLLNAPPLDELLLGVLQRIAAQPLTGMSSSLDEQLARLLEQLRQQRCLLILDNLESILQAEGIGQMSEGYESYAQLLRMAAESRHQSTILFTSRERPQGMTQWEKDLPWVHSLRVEGLDSAAGQTILTARGLVGATDAGNALVQRYSGHPLALKLVAETIQELFAGDISAFLAADIMIFDDIRAMLDQQFERLSPTEQETLFWLAVERDPVSVATLHTNLVPTRPMQEIVSALRALQRRSLVQPITPAESWSEVKFAAPNMVMEYLVDCLIELASREIEQEQPRWLHKIALMQAQALEYVRQSQIRLLLQPLAARLEASLTRAGIQQKVLNILRALRAEPHPPRGYTAGTLINLAALLQLDLGPLDLAGLTIWQADLRQANLAGSNLAGADLRGSRFADSFNTIRAVAISPDGLLVAGATTGGEIRLWDATNGQLVQIYRGHTGAVRSIAFSPDGGILASGSEDQSVRLWRVEGRQGNPISAEFFTHILEGHEGRVSSIAFHPTGKAIASGSTDGTVRVWNLQGETTAILPHDQWVWAIAFSPDGNTLASGTSDPIIRLWDFHSSTLAATITGHTALVSSLAFDPTGARLASGSYDYRVYVWDVASQEMLYTFDAALDLITSVVFSPDGSLLATGGDDRMIRVWDMQTGKLHSIFQGHMNIVCGLAFYPDGQTVVSGGADARLCMWDVHTASISRLFAGHNKSIFSIAFHPDGKTLASSHFDHRVRLWDLEKHVARQTLSSHTLIVSAVAFNHDGTMLASSSGDKTIRLWAISPQGNAQLHSILRGHQRDVTAVDFTPDGEILYSSSDDQRIGIWNVANSLPLRFIHVHDAPIRNITVSPSGRHFAITLDHEVQLWDAQSKSLCATLKAHGGFIFLHAFSPDGQWMANSGSDGTIAIWDISEPTRPQHKYTLRGHSDRVFSFAFHPSGNYLVSSSADRTVRIWDMQTHQLIQTLSGHTHWVTAVAYSPDGKIIASCGIDETIRIWDAQRGEVLHIYPTPGPYEGMDISGVKGITEVERATIKLLGAIEQQPI